MDEHNEAYFNGMEDGYEGFSPVMPDNEDYMRGYDCGIQMVYSENPNISLDN